MTSELERQAARLFTVGFHGKSLTDDLRGLIARGVGGVVYFTRNVGSPEEVLEPARARSEAEGQQYTHPGGCSKGGRCSIRDDLPC